MYTCMSAFDVLSDALHELTRRNVSSAKGRSSTPTLGPVGQMSPKERVDHQKNVSVISRHKLPLLGHFRFRFFKARPMPVLFFHHIFCFWFIAANCDYSVSLQAHHTPISPPSCTSVSGRAISFSLSDVAIL